MGKKLKKDSDPSPNTGLVAVLIESHNCSTVVLMLASEEVEVLIKACEAIYRFALKSDENKLQLYHLKAHESLKILLKHEDIYVRRYAVMAYSVMVAYSEVRASLRRLDPLCITRMIEFLNDDDDVCCEFACLFLYNMSNDFINKIKIREAGGTIPIINLIASSDPDIQKNSLDCVNNLIIDYECRKEAKRTDLVQMLMDRMNSDYPAIQLVALKVLETMMKDADSRLKFREADGLEKIMNFMVKKFCDLHIVALQVLSNCLVESEAMEDIRHSGTLEKLILFIGENFPTQEVKLYAAQAIAKAAKNATNIKMLHEENIEQCLVNLLNLHVDNEDILIAVCQAIANLSDNVLVRDTFGNVDGIPLLVALIPSENPLLSQIASLALANVTLHNVSNSNDVLKNGGVESLIATLQSDKDSTILNSSTCLINMSIDASIR